ncbi:MAG TPA: serine hydrolase domain-containing protein [Verrucomicrobiae bacterium]|nr:serine hydrolase domain-containing protein [Verrucomicrobiae bacterium]
MNRFLLLAVCLMTAFGARADQVDKIVKDEMAKLRIPGVALAIIQNGRRVKTGAYGYSNLELKTRVTPDTVFEIGSITKQFTAACIMILAQEGKLSVDAPISRYLTNTPPSWSKITVRNLLTHTSGIKNYTGLDGFELTRHLTQAQFIEKIGALPLDFQPGDKYAYCNTGFNLLGYIIENVSGENYWDFLRKRILQPLGMSATTSRNPRIIIPNRAEGYEQTKSGTLVNRDYDLTDLFSAGSIVSTVGDLARWDAALNTDRILSESSKQEMWTPTKLNDGSIHQYGFAWMLSPLEGHRRISHTGETSGFNASFARFPADRLTVIVLCNAGNDNPAEKLANKIAPLYFLNSITKK